MDDDLAEPTPVRDAPRRRGRWLILAVAGVVVVGGALVGLQVFNSQLSFPYEGPSEPVRPGGTVEIQAPGDECGPLIVSIHSPSTFGQWNQTHSGNAIDDVFAADSKAWWSLSSSTYVTPVPCSTGGTVQFTLPTDVKGDVVAACDSSRRCAKVDVDRSGDE